MRLNKLSLSQRLFLLMALALLPAFLILLYNELSLRNSRESEVHSAALRSGQLAALEMERIVTGSEGILRAVARSPAIQDFELGPCSTYLADITDQLPQFAFIAAIDRGGFLRCRSSTFAGEYNLGDRSYFQQALATERFVVGEFTEDRIDNVAVLPLAFPISDAEGNIAGVVAAGLDLAWLGARLEERDFEDNTSLTIADRSGVIIAREPFPERFVGTTIPSDYLYLVRASAAGTQELTSQDGTRRINGYIPPAISGSELYISAGISKADAFRPIDEATQRSILLALLGGVIAFGAAWLVGRAFIQRPVKKLIDTIAAWRGGNEKARTGMTDTGSELDEVGVAIDKFLDELVAANASRAKAEEHRDLLVRELDHRVKNILATVQAVASQTFRNKGSIPKEALQAFNGRLAAMANAHKMLTSLNWERASMRETIAAALAVFESVHGEKFTYAGPDISITPKAAQALSMAVHELSTNAVKYGALSVESGRVSITWDLRPSDKGERFVFTWREQDGPAVEPPTRTGFGTSMIEKALAAELSADVTLSYARTGVVCTVDAPAEVLSGRVHAASPRQAEDSDAELTV